MRLLLLFLIGCGNAGLVEVTAYGEAFIEDGFTTDDGWTVRFSRFDVNVAHLAIAGSDYAARETVDLTTPSDGVGQRIVWLKVPADTYTHGAFALGPIEIDGTATKGAETKRFAWTFPALTRYTQCETTTRVPAGGTARFEITVHADHFFVDSYVSHEPALGFDVLAAADTNADGDVSETELRARGIGAFDPGNEDAANLWQWLTLLSRTVGHVDGEGHCTASE